MSTLPTPEEMRAMVNAIRDEQIETIAKWTEAARSLIVDQIRENDMVEINGDTISVYAKAYLTENVSSIDFDMFNALMLECGLRITDIDKEYGKVSGIPKLKIDMVLVDDEDGGASCPVCGRHPIAPGRDTCVDCSH